MYSLADRVRAWRSVDREDQRVSCVPVAATGTLASMGAFASSAFWPAPTRPREAVVVAYWSLTDDVEIFDVRPAIEDRAKVWARRAEVLGLAVSSSAASSR